MISNLDLLDKKIISELNQDVRASCSDIAKRVRSSKEVVNYRIARLIERRIIIGFITTVNMGYWPYKITARFSSITPTREQEVMVYLKEHPSTTWVTACTGAYDVIFTIMAKDPLEFGSILREIMENIGDVVQHYEFSIGIENESFGHAYISGKKSKETILSIGTFEPDEKDKQILQVLSNNAREHLVDIAKQTDISLDTVIYRIKRMQKLGIILRYRLLMDSTILGYDRHEIFLKFKQLSKTQISKIRGFTASKDCIEYYNQTAGNWDIELTAHFKKGAELKQFILELKGLFGDSLKSLETVMLFETYKYSFRPDEITVKKK